MFVVGQTYDIRYAGINRTIMVKEVHPTYIRAWDYLRDSYRSFRLDKIVNPTYSPLGSQIADASQVY